MIKASGLSMHYGPVKALNNVSFEVNKGEIVGLLGPNGAGKSTAMKILTTYLYPTSGSAMVAGVDVKKDPVKVRRAIGYLPEVLPLYMDMEVQEYLAFVGKARGLRGSELKKRMSAVMGATGLGPMYRKVIRELSKGFKQRTGLAQALLHDPEVVILDEPTTGLDPHQILEVRDLIANLAKEKTVILSTHILQEVETTADRIVIINRGEIVGNGSIKELRDRAKRGERLSIAVEGDKKDLQNKLSSVSGVNKVIHVGDLGGCAQFMVHSPSGKDVWREVSSMAQQQQWQVRELCEKPLTLEETFLTLTEKAAQGKEQVS